MGSTPYKLAVLTFADHGHQLRELFCRHPGTFLHSPGVTLWIISWGRKRRIENKMSNLQPWRETGRQTGKDGGRQKQRERERETGTGRDAETVT